MSEFKQEVRQFYDQVGWKLVGEDTYQNARFEDLRPVAREYIHRCHLRVARHLKPGGRYLLDAGSGPIQYPEYLEYSRGYQRRVCADISIIALKEARRRIGDAQSGGSGLFVVVDIANLPFKPGTFDSVVSLHTIHHLPEDEHLQAYGELYRVLAPQGVAAVVNGWPASRLMRVFDPLIRSANRLRSFSERRLSRNHPTQNIQDDAPAENGSKAGAGKAGKTQAKKGTFTSRHDAAWVRQEVGGRMPAEIRVWRSVSVRFLRALIHPRLGGRLWLRLIFWLEERFPHFFGVNGQYPLIVIRRW